MSGFRKYPVDLAMSIWRTVPKRISQTCCAYIHGMAKNCFSGRAVGTNPRTRNSNICIPWAQQASIHIQAWQRHAMHIHMHVHMYAKHVLYSCTHSCLHASIVYLPMCVSHHHCAKVLSNIERGIGVNTGEQRNSERTRLHTFALFRKHPIE